MLEPLDIYYQLKRSTAISYDWSQNNFKFIENKSTQSLFQNRCLETHFDEPTDVIYSLHNTPLVLPPIMVEGALHALQSQQQWYI